MQQRVDRFTRDKKKADCFYTSARWQRLRNWYIDKHPLCECCGDPAALVDHIVERLDGGADMDEDNLQALCIRCHQTKTAAERRKRGPKVYTY